MGEIVKRVTIGLKETRLFLDAVLNDVRFNIKAKQSVLQYTKMTSVFPIME